MKKMPKPVLNAKIRAEIALATREHYAEQVLVYVCSNRDRLGEVVVRRNLKFFAERFESAREDYGKRLLLLGRAMKRAGVA